MGREILDPKSAVKPATLVGFVGLGNQGGGIAERIHKQGWRLAVWGRRPAGTEPFAAVGCEVAATRRELGAMCDVVGVCVRADDDVKSVLCGERPGEGVLDGMAPGGVVVVHSTIAPASVIALGEAAAERGLWLLDSPVSGARAGALAGTMTLMVGGAAVALEAVRPVLAAFATNIVHVGPLGAGQSVKLINNGVSFANMVIVIEALRAAHELGFDWRAVAEVIRVSSGGSAALGALQTASALEKMASPTNNIRKDIGHLRALLRPTSAADAVLLDVADQATDAVKAFALQQQEVLGA